MNERLREVDIGPPTPEDPPRDTPAPVSGAVSVAQLAQVVRAIYIACHRERTGSSDYGDKPMPQWDGGETRFGVQRRSAWTPLVRFILQHNLDPVAYIRAQFWAHPERQPPSPVSILTANSLVRYQEYAEQVPGQLRRAHRTNLLSVNGHVEALINELNWVPQRAIRYALLETTAVVATGLFRYAMAVDRGITDVAQQFRDHALLQYMLQKQAYDDGWKGLEPSIPPELFAEATRLRTQLLGVT